MIPEGRPHPIFFFAESDPPILVNFFQIVTVSGIEEDRIMLHMSDGSIQTFVGEQTVCDILGLLEQFSIAPNGIPLGEALAKRLPKIHLVKPGSTDNKS